nr:class I SAM-dependent methyltransferase [Deltaproteobacteria bacterium]
MYSKYNFSGIEEHLEHVSTCPLCGGQKHSQLYSFQPFEVVRCTHCSLGYLSPRLTEEAIMAHYRDPGYFEGSGGYGYEDYRLQEAGLRLSFQRFLRILAKKSLTGGSLLEIGCGPGLFLDEAREYFSHRVGTEFSADIAQQALKFADKMIVGGLEHLDETDCFDVIIAINVIEHVYEPISFLTSICNHLRAGGMVILVTPDLDGLWRRLFRSRWPSFKIPEHIIYFNTTTLRQLGTETGLKEMDFFGFTQIFPLSLILDKLYIRNAPSLFQRLLIPVPYTMICSVLRHID